MNKFYCKCSKCKNEIEADMCIGTIPQGSLFKYKCDKCGNEATVEQGVVYCKTELSPNPIAANTFLSVHCMICGKQVRVDNNYQQYDICNECKEAIKWAKEQKQKQDLSKLIAAREKMTGYTLDNKPYWCDRICVCAECDKAIECVRRYDMGEVIDLVAEKIYQDTKNMEIK